MQLDVFEVATLDVVILFHSHKRELIGFLLLDVDVGLRPEHYVDDIVVIVQYVYFLVFRLLKQVCDFTLQCE